MTRRTIRRTGVVVVFLAVALLLGLARLVGQAPADPAAPEATPATPTIWGEPDLQGLWTTRYDTPLQRPAQYADQEFFTDEERADLDARRSEILGRDARPTAGTPLGLGGAYNRAVFFTHKETGPRTSLIVDPSNGRIPPLTPEVQARRAEFQAYRNALLKATDVCKNGFPGCAGGEYGEPSPRRFDPPPSYPATSAPGTGGAFNRADGPEDRSLGERCMAARLPDFGGAAGFVLQIIQSRQSVSIFYDTGQGQGWQRVIPVTDRAHLPPHVRIEPRCHEGNYGLPGLLAGARADEKAYAEGRGPHPATICTSGCSGPTAEENRDPLR